MKYLFTSLIILMCACFSAAAQTAKPGTASVTSTIRVRIPDFASVTLQENRIAVDTENRSQMDEQESRYSEQLELHANKRWILQTERLFNRRDLPEDSGSPQPPVLYLMYTATPE